MNSFSLSFNRVTLQYLIFFAAMQNACATALHVFNTSIVLDGGRLVMSDCKVGR